MKIVLDTETCHGFKNPLVYDLGWIVATDNGEIIKTRSYIIKETYDNKSLMETAYYKEKKPLYEMRLKSGYSKKVYLSWALRQLTLDMKKYGINTFAYNSPFDYRALNSTRDYFNKDKYNPLENGINDIMKAIKVITTSEEYKKFCEDNNFMTKHATPRPQTKAETLYRYLTRNPNYTEEHTALEDSKIELAILIACEKLSKEEEEEN